MAINTSLDLRNKFIYQVFVRQHSQTSDFKGLIKDLDRIKKMGVDIVYLLPIHPIGLKDRKGEIGSPYAIYDYLAIDKSLGTLDDFKQLVDEVHKRGMKIMLDMVLNHTSRDSVLTQNHPDWFYKKEDGSFANRVGDWSDITDLDLNKKEVWDYLVDVLTYWAKLVDGFRCDVAPLLPIEFWDYARKRVDLVNPNLIWLSESVELSFIKYLRDIGYDASTDSMIYQVFDIAYDYDIFSYMTKYLEGSESLERWMFEVFRQEMVYPKNYVKLRSFENHDQERIAKRANSTSQLINLTALQFFLRGTPMVYAGQEHMISKRPDLFELDLVPWNFNNSIENLITKLAEIKKFKFFRDGIIEFENFTSPVVISYTLDGEKLIGIFNLEGSKEIKINNLKDGSYQDLIKGITVKVVNSTIQLDDNPLIIKVNL